MNASPRHVGMDTPSPRPAASGPHLHWLPPEGDMSGAQRVDVLRLAGGSLFEARAVTFAGTSVDGRVDYRIDMELLTGAQREAEARRRGSLADPRARAGVRGHYLASVPADGDALLAATMHPFDPLTIPVGARVTLQAADFAGTPLAAGFAHVAAGLGVDTGDTAWRVERIAGSTVRVLLGSTGLLRRLDGAGPLSWAGVSLDAEAQPPRLMMATFELGEPAGQQAYAHFLGSGEIVAGSEAVGLSSVQWQGGSGNNGATRALQLRRADGSQDRVSGWDLAGDAHASITSWRRMNGSEGDACLALHFDLRVADHAGHIATLNQALIAAEGAGPLPPRTRSSVVFDHAQLQALATRIGALAKSGSATSDWKQLQATGSDVEALAAAWARAATAGVASLADQLLQLARGGNGAPLDVQLRTTAVTGDDPRYPHHRLHELWQQALDAVRRLYEGHGRASDPLGERLAIALVVAACRNGLQRIDEACFGNEARTVLAMQGHADDPDHRSAAADTEKALATPLAAQLRTLQQLSAQP